MILFKFPNMILFKNSYFFLSTFASVLPSIPTFPGHLMSTLLIGFHIVVILPSLIHFKNISSGICAPRKTCFTCPLAIAVFRSEGDRDSEILSSEGVLNRISMFCVMASFCRFHVLVNFKELGKSLQSALCL